MGSWWYPKRSLAGPLGVPGSPNALFSNESEGSLETLRVPENSRFTKCFVFQGIGLPDAINATPRSQNHYVFQCFRAQGSPNALFSNEMSWTKTGHQPRGLRIIVFSNESELMVHQMLCFPRKWASRRRGRKSRDPRTQWQDPGRDSKVPLKLH